MCIANRYLAFRKLILYLLCHSKLNCYTKALVLFCESVNDLNSLTQISLLIHSRVKPSKFISRIFLEIHFWCFHFLWFGTAYICIYAYQIHVYFDIIGFFWGSGFLCFSDNVLIRLLKFGNCAWSFTTASPC